MMPSMTIRALAAVAAFVCLGQAAAQSAPIDVTLEVIDDVSEIDAVVLRLEDAHERSADDERLRDEARERDELDRSVRDAELERDTLERETATDRAERRELQNEEDDLARDFERRQATDTRPAN